MTEVDPWTGSCGALGRPFSNGRPNEADGHMTQEKGQARGGVPIKALEETVEQLDLSRFRAARELSCVSVVDVIGVCCSSLHVE